jgi:hypothetical protein
MNARQRTIYILVLVMSLILSGCGPASAPTASAIAGIETPITVEGVKLIIVMATNDTELYDSGPFDIQHSAEETIIHIEAQIVSGTIDHPFAKGVSLTDNKGKQCPLASYDLGKPYWEFRVPKASKSFTLHFPDGQKVKLDPILKMVP